MATEALSALDTAAFLERLAALDVRLALEDGKLRCSAPVGVLVDELRDELRARRGELLRALGAVAASPATAETAAPRRLAPLSSAQQRLWFFQQLEPSSAAYNISTDITLAGPLDVRALEQAILRILARHDVLRTTFAEEDGEPGQEVHPVGPWSLPIHDLSSLTADAQAAAADAIRRRQADRAFDLVIEMPFRIDLLRFSPERFQLLLTIHHIAADGISFVVFLRELGEHYTALCEGRPSNVPPLRVQYADHAARQRAWIGSPERVASMQWWKEQLAGELPTLDLATDHPRPPLQTYRGAGVHARLDTDTLAHLRAIGRERGCTLYMTLLAAFAGLLYRHTGTPDIVVGAPVAHRDREELRDLIGMFVNTLALRCDVSGDPTFTELLQRVRETCLGAFAHQEVPFALLLDELRPPRDLSRTPLFQVVFNQLPAPVGQSVEMDSGLVLEAPPVERLLRVLDAQSKFDITFYVQEQPDGLRLLLVYNADLFAPARMEAMLAQYQRLLAAVALDAQVRIGNVLLEAPRGAGRVEHRLRKGAFEPLGPDFVAGTLSQRFAEAASRFAGHVAVEDATVRWTYAELEAEADRIARVVDGVAASATRVALLCDHDVPMVAAVLGVLAQGSAYVPLDPSFPEARLGLMLEDADATVLLCAPRHRVLAERLAAGRAAVVTTDAETEPMERALGPPAPDALAYLLYTSGSTGQPKAVMQSHRNALHHARTYVNALQCTPDDRLLLLASYTFDASLMDLFGALLTGASLLVVDVRDAGVDVLATALRERRPTVYHSTPTLYRALLPLLRAEDCESLRCVVMGGEQVHVHDVRRFRELMPAGAVFVNGFGPTESTLALQHFLGTEDPLPGGTVPVGHPVDGTEVLLLDADGRPSAVIGEIAVRSAHVALGYWRRPELTASAFLAAEDGTGRRTYRTGDIGRRRPDGVIEFLGRRDDQVKLRGLRIELGEIEAALQRHPDVAQGAVVLSDPASGTPMLHAFVVRRAEGGLMGTDLREFLGRTLPAFMVPSTVTLVSALPLTRTGKVDRRELAAQAAATVSGSDVIAPRDAVEEMVAAVWFEVLGGASPGVHDDFFAVGGNSLSATQIIARLRRLTGVDVPLRVLFLTPTVAGLAEAVRRQGRGDEVEPQLSGATASPEAPLSFSQERMWFLQQLIPDGTAYNMTAGALMEGPLDREAFLAGLRDLAARQASLRTTFTLVSGEPRQLVAAVSELSLAEHDLTSLAEADRLPAAQLLGAELGARVFDLERGPLWRLMLAKLADDRHVVVVAMHHSVSDLWSFGVMARDLASLYSARRRGVDPSLPRLDVHYADFARWQQAWFSGPRLERQLAFWRKRLAGVAHLDLPADRARPPIMTSHGARVQAALDGSVVERLTRFSAAEGVTPFMTLLAAFNVLLHRHTGQIDIAVGVPIANRTRVELEGLVGSFVNTLVHRNDVAGRPTFRQMLGRVRETALDAFEHQDLPFERLVRELAPERDASRSPLFQVLFNLANAPVGTDGWNDIRMHPVELDRRAAQFDLTWSVALTGHAHIAAVYNVDLFDQPTIERMVARYLVLLDAAMRDPDTPIAELDLLPPAERAAVLVDANRTEAGFPDVSLPELVSAQVARAADAPALEHEGVVLSYAELECRANRLARRLRRLGVTRGALVGVCLARGVELPVTLLAVLKAGAAYLPLDPGLPRQRLEYMLADGEVGHVVTEETLMRTVPSDVAAVVVDRDRESIAREPDGPLDDAPDPDDLAYVIYTSGSTGQPKGVEITHRALVNFLWSMRDVPGLGAGESLLAVTTVSFDIAGLEVYLPWVVGGRVLLASREVAADGRRLYETLLARQPDVMQATPATWRSLLDAGWRAGDTPRLRVFCGGEALPRDLADALRTRAAEVWNLYGPTETTIWSTVHRVTDDGRPVPIGRPIANTRVYVLDAEDQPAPIGVSGELYIGGAGLARGYRNRPELTASRFRPDPFAGGDARMYRTGDRVRWNADGTLEHLGRLDFQVKLRGYRIELGEIEAVLAGLPEVRQCVADVRAERLVAWLVYAPDAERTASEVRSALRESLPDYMVPSIIVPLDALPLTPNGKVDRRALPDPLRRPAEETSAHVSPTTAQEQVVAEVWQGLLEVERVGTGDNFFELGGHSLLAMRAVHLIEQRTGWRPDARLLFFKSLGQIAAAMPEPDPVT